MFKINDRVFHELRQDFGTVYKVNSHGVPIVKFDSNPGLLTACARSNLTLVVITHTEN